MFIDTSGFGVAVVASESIAEDGAPGGWFSRSALPRSVSASARVYLLHESHAVMVGTWEYMGGSGACEKSDGSEQGTKT